MNKIGNLDQEVLIQQRAELQGEQAQLKIDLLEEAGEARRPPREPGAALGG